MDRGSFFCLEHFCTSEAAKAGVRSLGKRCSRVLKEDIRTELLEIFQELLDHFGPRHWWPGETALEVIVGAILTQNVAWNNVEKAINNLKEEGLLSIGGLIKTRVEKLGNLIRPARYYNQKAARLKAFAELVNIKYEGDLEKLLSLSTPELRMELLALKGIGPETADSILLYAANRPIFVVDAYTKRIFQRLGYLEADVGYSVVQDFFTSNLPCETYLFNEYHALIVALGNRICLARRPLCQKCPLLHRCKTSSLEKENSETALGTTMGCT